MQNLSKQLGSEVDIEVKEFVKENMSISPEDSFKEMVKSGTSCDGLVISGHHTGSFGGKRAKGSLGIDFLEKLSCNPEHYKFFKNIKALWLQGCRTLGVGRIESNESVDFHTDRVGNVLEEDHLEQSFAQLNHEFSATLDQDNPLSSRYLRVFPRANVFGWTKTAPGEKAKSELSIPRHIAHMARLNDDRKKYFYVEDNNNIDAQDVAELAQGFLNILQYSTVGNYPCITPRYNNIAIEAWKNHGNPKYRYAFDNIDLNAYGALYSSREKHLLSLKKEECFLKDESKTLDDLIPRLVEILEDPIKINYLYNSLFELVSRYKRQKDQQSLERLRSLFIGSKGFMSFLNTKLTKPDLGILRKIEYYSFYRDITGTKVDKVEKLINEAFNKIIYTPNPEGDYNLRDFQITLFNSMDKHGLLSEDKYRELIKSNKVEGYVLGEIARATIKSYNNIENIGSILSDIVKSKKVDNYAVERVLSSISLSKDKIKGVDNIINNVFDLVKSGKVDDGYVLQSIVYATSSDNNPVEGVGNIFRNIVNLDNVNKDVFIIISFEIARTHRKHKIEGIDYILRDMIKSDKMDYETLRTIHNMIGNNSNIKEAHYILEYIKNCRSDFDGFNSMLDCVRKSL